MPYELCGTADVKAALEITTASYDSLISSLISSASSAIAERYQREFLGPGSNSAGGAGTRSFRVRGLLVDLAPFDLRTPGAVVLDPEETPTTLVRNSDYVLEPLGGARLGGSFQTLRLSGRLSFTSTLVEEFGFAQIQVAGDWGCYAGTTTLDDTVKRACVLTVASWLDRGVDAYAAGVADGREIRPDQGTTFAIPASAHHLLQPWARIGTV